jgi:hypothetical protein
VERRRSVDGMVLAKKLKLVVLLYRPVGLGSKRLLSIP